jgi:apolipoprotein N-acyltransferase
VETGRWLVQCSNGGISCVIDPNGRVEKSTPMFTRLGFVATVTPSSEITTYVRYGDWLPQLCVLIAGTVMVGIFGKKLYIKIINPQRS